MLIVIGLITLHVLGGLFTPYNYLTAKWDIAKGKPRILQYGKAMLSDKQAITIAPKFGFNYDIVAGCLVTTSLVNGIDAYNSVTTKYLNDNLGTDWKKKFDFQVDSLFRVDRVDTIRKTILAVSKVKEMSDYVDSISGGREHLFIWVLPQEKNGPNVRVSQIMPDSSIRVFYYYQVDPYSLQYSSVQY